MRGSSEISAFERSSLGKHSLDGRDVHEEKTDSDRDWPLLFLGLLVLSLTAVGLLEGTP